MKNRSSVADCFIDADDDWTPCPDWIGGDEIPAPEATETKPTALYRHFDSDGRLLYVGISLSAIIRLAEHRASPWFDDIARVEIERHPTRKAALAAERKAIRDERPLHNIVGVVRLHRERRAAA
jgi:hypothetical protein